MILPVFRAQSTPNIGTTGAVSINAPSGLSVGDLEILVGSTIAGGTLSITTEGGSAWTLITSISVSSGERVYAWWRINRIGDSAPSITASSDHAIGARWCYVDGTFDPIIPVSTAVTGTESSSDTSFSFSTGGTTTRDNSKVVCIASHGTDTVAAQIPQMTNASLTNLESIVNHSTLNGGGGGYGATHGDCVTAGSMGTFACTYVSSSQKSYMAFAIISSQERPYSDATLSL